MITAEGYEGFFRNDNEVLGFRLFLWSVSIRRARKNASFLSFRANFENRSVHFQKKHADVLKKTLRWFRKSISMFLEKHQRVFPPVFPPIFFHFFSGRSREGPTVFNRLSLCIFAPTPARTAAAFNRMPNK